MWDSFWDFSWYPLVIPAFVVYVMLLGTFADLFRDRGLSGWLRAVWVVLLLFPPSITALVYLIAPGPGMSQREMAAQLEVKVLG